MKIADKIKILYQLGWTKRHPKIFSFHDCLPDVFSRYLELLMLKRYRILGGQELAERLNLEASLKRKRPLGAGVSARHAKEAVLTFDDGRRNCWTVIFPLLKKYNIKAIFFVVPSRIKDTDETYPNLEDYWKGKVTWENLYLSHRRQPYLTWKELEIMQSSGLVDVYSHSLRHDIVFTSSRVIDFQHPGVYEIPVYFDEWLRSGQALCDGLWGAAIYERAWVPLVSNQYFPNQEVDILMNEFVKKNGGFLFFKRKDWRKKLFEYYQAHGRSFSAGTFGKIEGKEDAFESIADSKKIIEDRLQNTCAFFSLPLYQGNGQILALLEKVGYRAVFTGFAQNDFSAHDLRSKQNQLFLFRRIPSFWIKFLNYF